MSVQAVIVKDRETAAETGVKIFIDLVRRTLEQKGSCRVVLPTGGSPKRFYELLTERFGSAVSWSSIVWITLDELYGIPTAHPASFYRYLSENLFEKLAVSDSSVIAINPTAENPDEECRRFGALCGGADIALLGMGSDGHIGMNFPPCDPRSAVHTVIMPAGGLPSTVPDTAEPMRGITMGMNDILSAEHIILLVDGAGKSDAAAHLLSGEITENWPVTYLNSRENCIAVIAEDALPNPHKV